MVRCVVANNPSPYTAQGTCTYLVGRGDVAVIDPGPDDPTHVEAILGALRPGEQITHLFATHTHSDHSPAARRLGVRTGAQICGYGPQLRFIGSSGLAGANDAAASRSDSGKPPVRGGDPDFRPGLVLRDGDVVKGESWTLEAVHTPGHASNHLCYALREERALFTGDHVMGWSTTVIPPPDGGLTDYIDSLQKLLHRPQDATYFPAHGPRVADPHPLVRALVQHRQDRNDQILQLLATGPATIDELVPVLYAQVPEHVWPAAGSSVYAHLLHLHQIGIIECMDGSTLERTSRVRIH